MTYVVIAEKEELKLVKDLGYDYLPIIITGCGGVNVIQALSGLPKFAEIINIGYCGSNYYNIGQVVNITGVATLHENAKFNDFHLLDEFNYLPYNYENSICFTSTDFVTSTKIKEPCVFDMELAYIRAMFDNVSAIKVVSDNLNKKEYCKTIKK